METSLTIQMSDCHSGSVQAAEISFNQPQGSELFVELVLNFQKKKNSSAARLAVERFLLDFYPRLAAQALLCLLATADEPTLRRFASTQLFSVETAKRATVSVVVLPNPNSIGSWGNMGRFFITTRKEGEQAVPLHFTNQASAVYYLMYLIHRLQAANEVEPINLNRNREAFIQLYHQVYDIADGKLRERVQHLLHRKVDGVLRAGRQNELRRDIWRHLETVFQMYDESCKPYAMTAKTHLTVPQHLIRFEGEAQRLLHQFHFA